MLSLANNDYALDNLLTLRGKNLACWCRLCAKHAATGKPLDEPCPDCAPCHADVLLEFANKPVCEPA
jgi:Zn finger protein HypA/HybF involved in hydrogenase expression